MSDLVRTAKDIWEHIEYDKAPRIDNELFLVLPKGLDCLEEMLRKELLNEEFKVVSSVFVRFKKEHGIEVKEK